MTGKEEMFYPYIKLREEFGKQPRFLEDHFRIHVNIKPNKNLKKKFRRMALVDREAQAAPAPAEDYMNTETIEHAEVGVLHIEGGWPKDVGLDDPEMIARHRKKLEKEESYTISLPIMTNMMEKYVKQNNAIELFEEHCPRKWRHKDKYKTTPSAQTIQIYRDYSYLKRSVHKIDWAPDNLGRMAVAHLPRQFDRSLRESATDAYIWDIENPGRPESMLRSGSHITDLHFHQKDFHSVIGACFNGTVECWDTRIGPNPQMVSPLDNSHTDICSSALWVNSKSNAEFFSGGMDGQVIWWDARNMEEKLDSLWADPEKGSSQESTAVPITALEYEHTIPTKFIAGVETGNVLIFMKKGKSPTDRLANNYKAHRGPIRAIQRNPTFVKNFLTVGDSTCRIFAEDCRDSSIMWTAPNDIPYTHGAWIPSRPSCFGVTRADGHVDIWDLLRDGARPHVSVKVADAVLTYFAPCTSPSKFLACGTSKGAIYLQRLSESLYKSEKTDKPILAAVFERESRREKYLEFRYREIKLKKRDKDRFDNLKETQEKQRADFRELQEAKAQETGEEVALPDYTHNANYDIAFEAKHDPRTAAEREFFRGLEQELREKGVDAWEEYKEHEEAVAETEFDENADLEITAADLGAMHFEEEPDPNAEGAEQPAVASYSTGAQLSVETTQPTGDKRSSVGSTAASVSGEKRSSVGSTAASVSGEKRSSVGSTAASVSGEKRSSVGSTAASVSGEKRSSVGSTAASVSGEKRSSVGSTAASVSGEKRSSVGSTAPAPDPSKVAEPGEGGLQLAPSKLAISVAGSPSQELPEEDEEGDDNEEEEDTEAADAQAQQVEQEEEDDEAEAEDEEEEGTEAAEEFVSQITEEVQEEAAEPEEEAPEEEDTEDEEGQEE